MDEQDANDIIRFCEKQKECVLQLFRECRISRGRKCHLLEKIERTENRARAFLGFSLTQKQ